MLSELQLQLKTLPDSPGVYQYFDQEDKILYVGKAKNLKKRVSSYFTKQHDYGKTKVLVKKIRRIEFIVVDTETDALLLENNLIKKYQPRYNILLKDDKSYPWICIKKEAFPRVFMTRNVIKDGSQYYGPYTSVKTVRILLDLIKELYPLRTCNYDLSKENIESGKYKVCLEYHLGNCLGPCEGLQAASEYEEQIKAIRQIIRGNFKESIEHFKNKMLEFSTNMEFEQAQLFKDKLTHLEAYQAKSTVVNPSISDVDVFSVISDDSYAYVNFFKVMNGSIIQSHTTEIKKKLEETDQEILELAVFELRNRFKSRTKTVYLPYELELGKDIRVVVPKMGDKKKLVDLSMRNAKYFRQERFKQVKIVDPDRHANRILEQLKSDLRLKVLPRHIECFDNSNIQGTHPVAACVVFKNAKPSKKDYRHFNIKTVIGPDDFASMEEVVYRRYRRLLDEDQELPQLIVIDGGKGQLSSSLKALERLGLRGTIAIIGIAKRLEEIYYPGDSIPLYLDKSSESLKLIQYMRNEAHRFGITFHRNKRSKSAIGSSLSSIPGIGDKTVVKLLKDLKTVGAVKKSNLSTLESSVGKSKAQVIFNYFNPK
ncbi:MAG: excinuclease ABC subunit UvrC [Flavobacteriaceae bacterium]